MTTLSDIVSVEIARIVQNVAHQDRARAVKSVADGFGLPLPSLMAELTRQHEALRDQGINPLTGRRRDARSDYDDAVRLVRRLRPIRTLTSDPSYLELAISY